MVKKIINGLFYILYFSILFQCEDVPNTVTYNNVFDNDGSFDKNPPVLNIEVSPDTGDIISEFTFDATGCYEPESPEIDLAFRWDFNGDLIWDTDWSRQKIIKKKFNDWGSYDYHSGNDFNVVNLDVKGGNNKEYIVTDTIYVNSYPLARMEWQFKFVDPELIFFDASSSIDSEDSTDLLYRWDYDNDGEMDTDWSNLAQGLYRYEGQESWHITLQVKDKLGYINSVSMQDNVLSLDGLIAYYPLNGDTKDASGHGHDGINNGCTFINNKMAYFDGIDDYIDLGNSAVFKPIQYLSFFAFLTFSSFDANELGGSGIFSNNDINESRYGFNMETDALGRISTRIGRKWLPQKLISCCGFQLYENEAYFINSSIWHNDYTTDIGYLFFIGLNNEINVFMDWVDSYNYTIFYDSSKKATIGKVNNLFFQGTMDNVVIFNRILLEPELLTIYHHAIFN